jgi:hypothetical protein
MIVKTIASSSPRLIPNDSDWFECGGNVRYASLESIFPCTTSTINRRLKVIGRLQAPVYDFNGEENVSACCPMTSAYYIEGGDAGT